MQGTHAETHTAARLNVCLPNVSSDDASEDEGSGQEEPNDDVATPAKSPHADKDLLNGRCVRTPLRPTQYTHDEKTQHR